MLILALFSLAAAQPGIQQISFGNGYHFGVAQSVGGSNPCPAFIECRACTSSIGCVWSGSYCYQVVYQVTTCSGTGCATNPSQCPATSNPPATCNTCSNSGCPSGQNCQPTGTAYCAGTCQTSTTCPYGSLYDSSQGKCVIVSCRVANACQPGYTCNVGTCARSPCPVVCTAPTSCNACDPNPVCGQNQICQVAPTPASAVASYSSTSCVGTCVDSTAAPRSQVCYSLTSCGDCTSATYKLGTSCVWNGVQCYPGNFACNSRDCVTIPANCPSTCAVPTCEACVGKSGCLWTGSSCYASTAPCTGTSCVQQQSQCLASSTCPSLTSCTTCLAVSGCIWNGASCYFSNTPCDPRSNNCVSTCDVQQPCNGQDCTSCVAAANCRWSSSSSSCYYSTTPCTDRYCANTQSQCLTSQTCYGVTTCRACAKISGCLWYGDMCYAVPCQGAACVALGYTSQCPQPQCERASICTDCTNTDGCVWTGYSCVATDTYTCTNSQTSGCATNNAQCPSSNCAYGEVYDNSQRRCRAILCDAPNACPVNYTCNTQPNCGASVCPVVCTAPADQCPLNEQWTYCSSSTCFEANCNDNYATRVCAQDCRSGCQCKNGFARGPGGACVSQASCSSYYGR